MNQQDLSGSAETALARAVSDAEQGYLTKAAVWASIGQGYAMLAQVLPCEHAPDGGNHPEVGHG